ncbi:MAG: hypothetical protein OWT28_01430, partial [Firmicutes bacterium]|nr:hypothetical protein [Bacillota bacterium]
MDDTEQTSWSNQEGLGRRRSAPEEESLLSEVEIGREDPVQQWHLRSFERQALREIVPMVQSLQMHELPMFTMPQLLQACSEVIEQICSVAMEGETPTSESADQKDEVMVLRDRFSLGYGCYVDQDAL